MSEYAVFFDPSRKRWWWIKRISTVLGLLSVIIVSVFLLSIFIAPVLPDMPGITSAMRRTLRAALHVPRRQTKLTQFLAKRDRDRLIASVAREKKAKSIRKAQTAVKGPNIVAAFYAPWQETGLHSLRENAPRMTHILPAWVHLSPDGGGLDLRDFDPQLTPHNNDVLDIAHTNNLSIVPVFSNAQLSDFDRVRAHRMLTTPELQDHVIFGLLRWVTLNKFQGINIDLENLATDDYALLIPFVQKVRAAFAPRGLSVSMDLESRSPINWRRVSAICDFVVVMAYDEHSSSSKAGPISSIEWYRSVIQKAAKQIPREKLVIGMANYAYDWTEGEKEAEPLSYQEALVRVREYRPDEPVEKLVDFDPVSLNPNFWYVDEANKDHEVWMLDAITLANQWTIAEDYAPRGIAIWALGLTDPSIWKYISRTGIHPSALSLREISYPYDVEFIGDGEILRVRASPTKGSRSLETDPQTGLFTDEVYHNFPTSFVIDRSGYHPKEIALTIDDGPAAYYTADMLDELKTANVKATFFLIGQNAERYPSLVKRIWREGHEIGNHSYTHPNIGAIPEQRARAELNATQRVIQSIIGRSTYLFRPPYNADAEPTSREEVTPVVIASALHYVVVGEYIDPQDWDTTETLPDGKRQHRSAKEMLDSVLSQLEIEKGSCILLHDGGGDRSETVKLIPMLVSELTKRGYKFVTVSQLVGKTRDDVNPPVSNTEALMMAMLASDRIVFELWYVFELFLTITFMSAIGLGAGRMLFVTTLALIARGREKRATFNPDFNPSVSVVIAAFNEEKVIARTIESVLASHYPDLEIVVVDDGSLDDTSGEVERRFGHRPEIRLLRQSNGGKAAALNHGISIARGEIIVALDADTLFLPDTITKLIRRFENPEVGAVAGNVKVGNRINPLTYWQSIEYITSQNLDRRAYAAINSVSVVPGAVGAWRRTAIVAAGGYTTDTMAEDMDLTWRIRQNGWQIETDSQAIGFTEAPDTFRMLFRQRFRWAFGTLQSLWKHRSALGRYGWFGRVMLPSLWLFQVVYQVLSPVVDLQILWTVGNVVHAVLRGRLNQDWQPLPAALSSLYLIAFMYAFFFVVELIGAAIAFKLDHEDGRMLMWLFWQRFLYRQLMYAVLLKSVKTAISGMRTGWGKLERKGTVDLANQLPVPGDRLPVSD
jgi:cellulose synthase/poly-beta-1,6-N-acetylglucosamine synthase-like glycosyltransferase/spore germination protein YaaH/peptidoglycan/xylan/chitin deacetylase (PgdA/CDA1 family)